jgi:ATP-dependent RNA helicase DeaD
LAANIKKIRVATIYGGESYEKQFKALKQNPQIIIGTPGRIIDQMNRGNISFANVKYLVLDEADEMLKMGFQDDLQTILETMPKERQTALFSATLPPFIKKICTNYMIDPKMVKIEAQSLTVSAIDQQLYYVKKEQKKDLLVRLLDYYQFNSVMIFANTKAMVDELVLFLQQSGFSADGLHGDLKQGVRDRVMQSFRLSSVDILIATDVAARGIDIDGIEAIINYDLPNENEIYVHRIGRTARAGASGVAISFATTRQHNHVKELEAFINHKLEIKEIPSIKDIQNHHQKNLYLKIVKGMEENFDNHDYDALLMKLAGRSTDPMPLLVTLLKMIDTKDEREYVEIEKVLPKSMTEKKKSDSRGNSKSNSSKSTNSKSPKDNNVKKGKPALKNYAVVEVNIGEIDKARPNQLVCFFHDELKIHREHFGKIVIDKKYSYLEVDKSALKYFKQITSKKFNGHSLNYKEVKELPKK